MGEDTIARAISIFCLTAAPSRTVDLKLHGWQQNVAPEISESDRVYGSDLEKIETLAAEDPTLNEHLHPQLPYRRREVIWAVRNEQARTVEDVLARRTRALFLNAAAAIEIAPEVSRLLAIELQRDETFRLRDLEKFREVAQGYLYTN
jgi:glycerol-3-phosphate dehydrogenase